MELVSDCTRFLLTKCKQSGYDSEVGPEIYHSVQPAVSTQTPGTGPEMSMRQRAACNRNRFYDNGSSSTQTLFLEQTNFVSAIFALCAVLFRLRKFNMSVAVHYSCAVPSLEIVPVGTFRALL